jgi:hypothetical protein
MPQKPINMKLVYRVLDHIKEDLHRLEMGRYGVLKGSESLDPDSDQFEGDLINKKFPECETKCCFGGWGVLLTTPKSQHQELFFKNGNMKNQFEKARKLFGFTVKEADHVFAGDSVWLGTTRKQFKYLKKDINKVLEARGMTERV